MLFKKKGKEAEGEKAQKATNPKGPKKMWVPKVNVASDASVSYVTSRFS